MTPSRRSSSTASSTPLAVPGDAPPSRRAVVVGGAAAVATLAAGCVGGTAPRASAAATSARSTPAVRRARSVAPADWSALDAKISGDVLTPGEGGYATARQLFDPRWDNRSPAAVVRVRSTADVVEAVGFARDHDVPTVVRAGGHSYVGASTATGAMVIDLRALDGVSLSGTTATVGGGATLYPVKAALAAHGRSIPTGTCPTVGAGGLTLGGGVGVDTRAQGLTCDAVTGATLVTGDGQIRRVDASTPGSLYWGLRGGGGGMGVVTVWRYRTYATRRVGIFLANYPTSAATRVLTGWSRWLASAPRSAWATVHVEAQGSAGVRVRVVGVTAAGDEGAQLGALSSRVGSTPSSRSTRVLDHLAAVRYVGGGTTSARSRFVAGSDVVRVMTTGTAQAIVETMARRARAGGTGAALVDPIDGRVQDLATGDAAFPWRGHTATVQWYLGIPAGGSYGSAETVVRSGHQAMGSRSSGQYLNYVEPGRPLRDYLSINARRVSWLRETYGVR